MALGHSQFLYDCLKKSCGPQIATSAFEVIILHGTKDSKVPFEHGKRLSEIGAVPLLVRAFGKAFFSGQPVSLFLGYYLNTTILTCPRLHSFPCSHNDIAKQAELGPLLHETFDTWASS